VPFTPNEVYAAFADPARLAQWWGPNGFTNTFDTFEFTTGGQWKFTMHGPDGSNYYNESEFAALEPDRKVVIRHLNLPHFTLTVSLVPHAEGTQILWTQAFDDPAVAAAIRHIVEPSNVQNLERLQKQLQDPLG
jgi:uncharacterized protein YndB with AHSA1/START domain